MASIPMGRMGEPEEIAHVVRQERPDEKRLSRLRRSEKAHGLGAFPGTRELARANREIAQSAHLGFVVLCAPRGNGSECFGYGLFEDGGRHAGQKAITDRFFKTRP